MNKTVLPRWFKSKPLLQTFSKDQIDLENGIIKGVIMCQAGPAKGHGVHLENEFIEELIKYDLKHFKKTGLKARFGHPAMSDTTMGKQMGKFHDFRYDSGKAIADLHLLDSANLSPNTPGMKDWMLSMAQEADDFVMSSIVFQPSRYYQKDSGGEKVYVWEYDDDGNYQSTNSQLGKVFVEFGKEGEHHYTDMVEAGAATDKLFSQQFNQDKFAVQVVEFVQEHPDLLKFLQEKPGKVTEFCQQLNITLPKPSYSLGDKFSFLKKIFGSEDKDDALSKLTKEFETEKQASQATIAQLTKDKNTAIELEKELRAKIKELSERIPEGHSDPEKPPKTKVEAKKYSAPTLKAIEQYKRRNKNKS